jgi:HK97 family phage prohead protease
MKMPSKVERRYLLQEFRVTDGDKPAIQGYAAVFDSPSEDLGWFTESLDPHAFDAVMGSNPDCRALWNHNPDVVLGRTTSGTLKLSIDARGLAYEIDPPDTQAARDLMVSLKRKDVTGSSFGFIVKRDQWTDEPDGSATRRILEIEELLDISPVTYPAYVSTSSSASRIPASCPAEIRSRLEARKAAVEPDATLCECECAQCVGGDCGICSDPDCDQEHCACQPNRSARSKTAAKRVDGHDDVSDDDRSWKELTELRVQVAQHRAA